jgi:hypothetical protein
MSAHARKYIRGWRSDGLITHPYSPAGGSGPGYSRQPGTVDHSASPLSHPDSAAARRSDFKYLPDESISSELSDAPEACVPTRMAAMSLAQMRVLAWLRVHSATIVANEGRFHVDRRAIAGAIAWEALFNVRGALASSLGRFVGAGKAHVRASLLPFSGDDTLVAQMENATWLPAPEQIPKQTHADRVILLRTPEGAILYIAAAMNAAAGLAERRGFSSIRNRPEVLTFFWQKKDLKTWDALLAAKRPGDDVKTGPDPKVDMDKWVVDNVDFLRDAVGEPETFRP